MNLSKVYSTQDTFQPEDIIRAKLIDPPVFNQTIITAGKPDNVFQRQELTAKPQLRHVPPKDIETPHIDTGKKAVIPENQAQQSDEQDRPETNEPLPIKETKAAPPPPPPGIPEAEVDRRVAEAFQKGIAEGLEQAENDFGAATAALTLICQQLDTLRETVIQNSVGEIQDLVITIAEKVIRHSVQEQNQTIVDTVEEAIQKAVKSEEFYIYVHPDDYAVIAAKADDMIAGINGLNNIVVKKDSSVDRGGCRLESENCTVDATISSQLNIIREHIHEQ